MLFSPVDKSILEDQNKDAVEQYEGKSLPGTMVLVIGIILGAFVAMILIVIFVLKKRIRVDGNGTVKGDEGLAGSSGPPGAAPGGPPGINHGPPGGAAPRYQVLFIWVRPHVVIKDSFIRSNEYTITAQI